MPVYTIQTPEGRKLKIEAASEADAMRGAQEWSASQSKKLGPRIPVIGDAIDAGGEALGQLAAGVQSDYARAQQGKPAPLFAPIRNVANAINVIPAAATAAVTRPLARGIASALPFTNAQTNEEILDKALMGGRAVPGRLPTAPPKAIPRVTMPKAEARVAQTLERAITRDGAVPRGVAAAARAKPYAPAFQAGGENLSTMAEVVAGTPGKGQRTVRAAVDAQKGGAHGRVKTAAAEAFGGDGGYFERLDAARTARAAEAKRGMDEFGVAPVRLDDNSVLALRSDLARSAIREQAQNSLASPDPDIRADGARLMRLHDELLDNPAAAEISVRDAQNISRSLLKSADSAYRSGDGGRGEVLKGLGRSIRDNAAQPERGGYQAYGDWLKRYGDDSDGIEALEAGRNVFSGKMDMNAERLRKAYAGWSDGAKDNFRQGIGEALLDQVRRKGGVIEARQLLRNEEFRDRLRIAAPDDQSFDAFIAKLDDEVRLQDVANRVTGNSRTEPRAAARADLETQDGIDPLDALEGVMSPRETLKKLLRNVPRRDRSVLGDPEMNELLGKALSDPDEMTRLLNLLEAAKANAPIGAEALGRARAVAIPATEAGLVLQGVQTERSRAR